MIDPYQRIPEWVDAHPDWVADARDHLHACYPDEGCGVFLATGFMAIPNTAPDPQHAFRIPPEVLLNYAVLGIVHSHPDGNAFPSKADMQHQIDSALPWAVAVTSAEGCKDLLWFGDELPDAPLVGRQFMYGVFDCYTLIRDWYWQERKVRLPSYPRDWDWWHQGESMYEDGLRESNRYVEFRIVDTALEPLEVGDIFYACARSEVANHGGVYVGNGEILHHFERALSRRSPVHLWAPQVTKWIRMV